MSEVTPTQVKYEILIRSNGSYLKIGKVLIKRLDGDIYYIPSQREILSDQKDWIKKIIDKISWHKSGCVHVKLRDSSYDGLQQRQLIQNVGFQEVVRDIILDFSKLPVFTAKPDSLDVVLDIRKYNGPIQFLFSVVSGRLIIAKIGGKNVPIKASSENSNINILATEKRCLGQESDNADKLLQYTIYKYIRNEQIDAGRRIFVPGDSKISRDVDKSE